METTVVSPNITWSPTLGKDESRNNARQAEEARLKYLIELEKLAPLVASINAGAEVLQYSARLYIALAIREPKFAHLYTRLLCFLHESCEKNAKPTEEVPSIRSIVLKECYAMVGSQLLLAKEPLSLKERTARFIVLEMERKATTVNFSVLPSELQEYFPLLKELLTQECQTFLDEDEELEVKRQRQKKRGVGNLIAELFNCSWVPLEMFIDILTKLMKSLPCMMYHMKDRDYSNSCCLPSFSPAEYPPESTSSSISSQLYFQKQLEERVFQVNLAWEMIKRTVKNLIESTDGVQFLLSHTARAKSLLVSHSPHMCITLNSDAGQQIRDILLEMATAIDDL